MKRMIAVFIAVLLMAACLSLTTFAEEGPERVPVVAQVPEGWEAPHLWAWADDGTNAFAAWPERSWSLWPRSGATTGRTSPKFPIGCRTRWSTTSSRTASPPGIGRFPWNPPNWSTGVKLSGDG